MLSGKNDGEGQTLEAGDVDLLGLGEVLRGEGQPQFALVERERRRSDQDAADPEGTGARHGERRIASRSRWRAIVLRKRD